MRTAGRVRPWAALAALCLGLFVILIDSTIVSVATPDLMRGLDASENQVLWVTSAYLLAYLVPLLVTGRLGDRFGARNLFMTGLAVFTLGSLWCGLTGDIGQLITARIVQGLGSALLSPQTMAVITRIFPAQKRGQAMGIWSAVAGLAILAGPIVGGALLALGWQWIFFVNVPVGAIGLVLAAKWVPKLPTHAHSFDWFGVGLSAVGVFLLVFAVQDGQNEKWRAPVWVMIGLGVLLLACFVYWQHRNRREPLMPLSLFRDRNFTLSNIAITLVGLANTALAFPLMLYPQNVLGFTPLGAAILVIPTAVISGALSPFVGRLSDRVPTRYVAGIGLACYAIGLGWLALAMQPGQSVLLLEAPLVVIGIGSGFTWPPLAAAATRNLPAGQAGAGSGVYNATRQFGAVIGSAAIAVLMQARLAAHGVPADAGVGSTPLSPAFHRAYSLAMGQSLMFAAVVMVAGLIAALFLARAAHLRHPDAATGPQTRTIPTTA